MTKITHPGLDRRPSVVLNVDMPRRRKNTPKPADHPDRRVGLAAINRPGGKHDRRKQPRRVQRDRAINDSKEA